MGDDSTSNTKSNASNHCRPINKILDLIKFILDSIKAQHFIKKEKCSYSVVSFRIYIKGQCH